MHAKAATKTSGGPTRRIQPVEPRHHATLPIEGEETISNLSIRTRRREEERNQSFCVFPLLMISSCKKVKKFCQDFSTPSRLLQDDPQTPKQMKINGH